MADKFTGNMDEFLHCLDDANQEMVEATQKFRATASRAKLNDLFSQLAKAEQEHKENIAKGLRSQIAEYKHFGIRPQRKAVAATGRSYAASDKAEFDTKGMSVFLERAERAQGFLGKSSANSFFGADLTKMAGEMAAGDQDSELAKIENKLRKIAVLKEKGFLVGKQDEKMLVALQRAHAPFIKGLKERAGLDATHERVAIREKSRLEAQALSGTTKLRNQLGAGGAKALDWMLGNKAGKAIMAAEDNAAKKPMGYMAGMASMGMSKLASSGIAAMLNPITATVAAMAAAFRMIIGAVDDLRRVQGQAVPAMAAGGGKLVYKNEQLARSLMDATGANHDLYMSLSGTNQFVPLVSASLATMGTLGSRSLRDTKEHAFATAKSFMEVGVMGQAMGLPMEKSMQMAAGFSRVFNKSGKDISKTFKEYIALSQIAGQSIDEFGGSIGDLTEYAKSFGAAGAQNILSSMGAITMNQQMTQMQKELAQGAGRSLLTSGLPYQAGLSLAARGQGGLMGLARAGNPMDYMTENVGALVKSAMAGMAGADEGTKRLSLASIVGQLTRMPGLDMALFKGEKDIEKQELFKAVTGQLNMTQEAVNAMVLKEASKYDAQAMGVYAATQQVGTLERIANMIENFINQYVRSSAGISLGLFPLSRSGSPIDIKNVSGSQPSKLGG